MKTPPEIEALIKAARDPDHRLAGARVVHNPPNEWEIELVCGCPECEAALCRLLGVTPVDATLN